MSAFEGKRETSQAPAPLSAQLTHVRSKVRSLPDGSTEQLQNSLLAEELPHGVTPRLKRQLTVMSAPTRRGVPLEEAALSEVSASGTAAWLATQPGGKSDHEGMRDD